jgi:Cu+-exporting ATPase
VDLPRKAAPCLISSIPASLTPGPRPWWLPASRFCSAAGGSSATSGGRTAPARYQPYADGAGVIGAAAIGQWTTAALIVFFMRLADWLEDLTTERSRRALEQLVALQPPTAHVVRDSRELEVPVAEVTVGNVVIVRPGERIPVDGEVLEGNAPVRSDVDYRWRWAARLEPTWPSRPPTLR